MNKEEKFKEDVSIFMTRFENKSINELSLIIDNSNDYQPAAIEAAQILYNKKKEEQGQDIENPQTSIDDEQLAEKKNWWWISIRSVLAILAVVYFVVKLYELSSSYVTIIRIVDLLFLPTIVVLFAYRFKIGWFVMTFFTFIMTLTTLFYIIQEPFIIIVAVILSAILFCISHPAVREEEFQISKKAMFITWGVSVVILIILSYLPWFYASMFY